MDHDFIFSLFLIFQTCWYIGMVINSGVSGNCVDGGEVFLMPLVEGGVVPEMSES